MQCGKPTCTQPVHWLLSSLRSSGMSTPCFFSHLRPNMSRKTLTKKVRRGLVFLDKHMSSPRRDVKHLKVPFGTCRGSGGSREEKRREEPWSGAQGTAQPCLQEGIQGDMEPICLLCVTQALPGLFSSRDRRDTSYRSICTSQLGSKQDLSTVWAKVCFQCSSAHEDTSTSVSLYFPKSVLSQLVGLELTDCPFRWWCLQ